MAADFVNYKCRVQSRCIVIEHTPFTFCEGNTCLIDGICNHTFCNNLIFNNQYPISKVLYLMDLVYSTKLKEDGFLWALGIN